jgi:hypothetical protein
VRDRRLLAKRLELDAEGAQTPRTQAIEGVIELGKRVGRQRSDVGSVAVGSG